jgi:uncharacterized protein (TIGR03083 family)
MADIADIVAAERRALVDVLAGLSDEQWVAPSLCAGWRVREVVAHVTMPFRYSTGRFVREMARSGGRFNRMADRCARRDAQAPPAELLAALRANERHPWQPPGGGQVAALAHDVIHGLDITTALGIDRTVPEDHLRPILATATGERSRKHFHVDLTGKRLCADDLDWTFGDGEPVHGRAQDLLLLLCGRDLPADRLRGVSG